MHDLRESSPFRIFLPATSANLGPAFDAAALAFDFGLTVEGRAADSFAIVARGCNPELCGKLDGNLIFDTYKKALLQEGKRVVPLSATIDNEIPLGMGCGSSAAAVLAGVALAVAFGGLDWDDARIVTEASTAEGHPDNVAACWYGGVVLARTHGLSRDRSMRSISVLPIPMAVEWPLLLAIPDTPLSTSEARRVLPRLYSRVDLIHNVQSAMMLVLALTQGRGEWLQEALSDRVHHPYRAKLCPLLPALSELSGTEGVNGVALSGAGPSVLMFLDPKCDREAIRMQVERHLAQKKMHAELRFTSISGTGARHTVDLGAAATR